jgi:Pentose-5-phosphate-3-epimerase
MIEPADPFLDAFIDAGADIVTVHAEAGPHLDRSFRVIRQAWRASARACPYVGHTA